MFQYARAARLDLAIFAFGMLPAFASGMLCARQALAVGTQLRL